MRRFVRSIAILLVLAINVLGVSLAGAVPRRADLLAITVNGQTIPNRYIVTLKPGVQGSALLARAGMKAQYLYDTVLNGFAGELTATQLAFLQRHADVLAIEPDQVVTMNTTQFMDSDGQPWGLDRIDQRLLPLSGTYTYTSTGAGVTAYVIDTGIQTSHPDFGGRAAVAFDALGGNGQDCNGHGTHVAGTIGGATYGVAKRVALRAVRVLNCNGSGTISGIISALNWLAANHAPRSVANMSLGGGFSASLNAAVDGLSNSGVFVTVAVGGSNTNACNDSPTSAATSYAVAASDRSDKKASFSSFGPCVDIYAPGVGIKSDWLNGGTAVLSGGSMAAPHAAGVAALYKATFGDAPSATVANWLNTNATPNVIMGNPAGTPNRLLYKASL